MKLNTGINLHDISKLLISKTGLSDTDVSLFLKELFTLIVERLLYEDSVEIDSLGVFSINNLKTEHEKTYYYLNFIPSSELIDSINKPFLNFEITKLNEGVDLGEVRVVVKDEEISGIDTSEESILYIAEYRSEHLVEADSIDVLDEDNLSITDQGEKVVSLNIEQTPSSISELDVIEDQNKDEEINIEDSDQEVHVTPISMSSKVFREPIKTTKRSSMVLVSILGIALIVTASAFFLWKRENKEFSKVTVIENMDSTVADMHLSEVLDTIENVMIAHIDTIETTSDTIQEVFKPKVNASVKPEVVTLTMGKTLRLIALEKYGHREFWVYIYIENKSKIANPNSVPVGVKLTIPPREKYGINANNSSSIAKAIARGNEELRKFK